MKKTFAALAFWFGAVLAIYISTATAFAQAIPPTSSCGSVTTISTALTASLQQLDNVAGILSAGNLPQNVITAAENLVSAVANVVSELASCITSGTTGTGSPATASSAKPKALASASGPIVTQLTDSQGNTYSVTYTYLPDGEVQASFTYSGQAYIVQDDEVGLVASDGSVTVNGTQYYYSLYGATGSSNFDELVSSIESAAPAKAVLAPGLNFSTPPNTAAGTYLVDGLYPVTVTTDADGNILSVQSVNASGYGSGIAWYSLGADYYLNELSTPGYYELEGSGVPSGFLIILQNVQVTNDASGNPASITGTLSVETTAELSQSGFADLSTATNPVTFTISATGEASGSGTQTITFTNSPTGGPTGLSIQGGYIAGVLTSSVSTATQSVSISAVLALLRAAPDVNTAISIAQNAGLTITGGMTDEDGDVSYLITTPAGAFVAAVGNYDASTAVGAPTLQGYVYGNTSDAADDVFLCTANVGSGTAAMNTFPDGKIYGMADAANYSVLVNCTAGSAVSCAATQTAANAAASAVTVAGGPPVVNNSSVATVNITWVNDYINDNLAELADSTPIVLADGTSVCNIRLSTPSLGSAYADQVINGHPGFLQQVITHEIGHCMGLGHSTATSSVMYSNLGVQPPGASFTADDEAVLAALRSDANIPVTCASAQLLGWSCNDPTQILSHNAATNAYSCESCPAGQVPVADTSGDVSCQSCPTGNFYQQVTSNSDGSLSIQNECNDSCSSAGGTYPAGYLYNILGTDCVSSCGPNQVPSDNGYQCECAPGMTFDMSSGECVQEGGSGSMSLSPDCGSGFVSATGQCYPISESTSTSNICFTLEDGSVQCSCADGYEQQGNSCVAVSSGGGGSESVGGYDCNSDGTCQYDSSGGDYSTYDDCAASCTDTSDE